MLKKNLFAFMLSTFVLMNAQPSFAVKGNEVDEKEKNSSRVQSLLKSKPQITKKSSTILRVPSGPMKPELVQVWIKKINKKPMKYSQYMIEGNTLWKCVQPKAQSKKETRIPSAPMKPELVQVWIKKINKKPMKYSQYMVEGNTLWKTE